jgi:FlaA1/EpsC-like NDP-sugar epimerase
MVRVVIISAAAYWLSWLLRFDFLIPHSEIPNFRRGLAFVVCAKLLAVLVIGLRQVRGWPHLTFPDLVQLLATSAVTGMVSMACVYAMIGAEFPRSVYALDPVLFFLLSGGTSFAGRYYREIKAEWSRPRDIKNILIYGAGVAGITLAREIRNNPKLGYRAVAFVDDDEHKTAASLVGLPVLGTGNDVKRVVARFKKKDQPIQEIVVAMPSATGLQIRAALEKGRAAGVPARIVPGLGELLSGKVPVGKMREISVTDILGREPVRMEMDAVLPSIAGRSVLVTGAAGSIGSELCQQVARLEPRCLIMFDAAESPLFLLEIELRKKYPGLELVAAVGDIRQARQVQDVIENYYVDSIFHAAAYKHVPLMERQICEAVHNNILGTWNVAQAAWRSGVASMVMISSDKAVNPTSVMGLTKRVAELIVSANRSLPHRNGGTKFVSVRFGNVLVSNGSVVPIFQKQIAVGGPVTVTHPDMRRFFMTVQEAVHLVLRASAMGKGSEVFVLDMGKPVRILDLARNMIRLAGFVPEEDIEIRFTGLRPGEKIFEELNLEQENTMPTGHPKIRVFRGEPMDFRNLAPLIAQIEHYLWQRDNAGMLQLLKRLVPEYRPPQVTDPAETAERHVRMSESASTTPSFEAAAG